MPVSSSTEHWIKPDALTINLNHFGDPDYLQVSVLAGAVVMAFKQDVIGYNAAHNYRTWPLEAANTYLETSSAYNVYARLTRSEVNARALIVYDTVLRDIEGREITYAENGSEVLREASTDYFFVFLGQISESTDRNGGKKERSWNIGFRFGALDTTEQKNYTGFLFEKMFRPHYDDNQNPDKITSIEVLSGLWTHSFISAKGISPNTGGESGSGLIKQVYGYNDLGNVFTNGNLNNTFNAYTIARLASRISYLEQNGGGSGGGGVADSIEWEKVLYKPSWLVDKKPSVSFFDNDAKYISSDSLADYATQQWVNDKGYATATDVANTYVAKTTFNTLKKDFDNLSALLNDDVQGKINTWHEVVDFLDEYSGSQDLATILSTMNANIATRLEKTKFAEYFSTEMAKWFVKDDANKGIKPVNSYGLYSDTYVSAKGVSTGASGGGGGTSYDRLDSWAEYTSAKAGYVLSALLGYDLHTRVNNLANAGYITQSALNGYAKLTDIPTIPTSLKNPYALSFGNKLYDGSAANTITASDLGALTSHQDISHLLSKTEAASTYQTIISSNNKISYSNISGTPTSLPASDVAAWAKAASKPSYAFSEITNKPTTLSGYGITDAYTATTIDSKLGGYLPLSGGTLNSTTNQVPLTLSNAASTVRISFVINGNQLGYLGFRELNKPLFIDAADNRYTLIHSGNYTDYALSTSGGTITGLLTIKSSGYPLIEFKAGDTTRGYYGFSGTGVAAIWDTKDWQTLIHSGNIGIQSVNYANIANHSNYTLQHKITSFGAMSNNTICGWYDWGNVSNSSFYKYTYGYVATSPDENIYSYIGFANLNSDMRVRMFNYGKDSGWKTIAFTDSNVASATKLQTPRSIWGQSFDGTGDISGALDNCNWVRYYKGANVSGYIIGRGEEIAGGDGLGLWTYGNTPIFFGAGSVERMRITSAGNVLIGTTTDWGFNLASIAICSAKTSGYLGNGGGAFFGNMLEGYGTAIWTQGDGNGYIQQGRSDGNATNHHLCLQSLGGNVGIGTTSPTEKLHVAGNIVATGSVTAKSSSDYRLKCEFDYGVDYQERLLSLGKVCDFNYTQHAQEREFAFADDKRHTSVIWQDARKANITGFCSVEEDGYGTINPLSSDLIFTMVGAIQQGIAKTEKIEDRVVRLEKENRELKEKINLLEGGRYGC